MGALQGYSVAPGPSRPKEIHDVIRGDMVHESQFIILSLFSPSVARSQELNIYNNSIPKEATEDHNDNANALTCVGTEAVRLHQ
jgi:hypothetical protein